MAGDDLGPAADHYLVYIATDQHVPMTIGHGHGVVVGPLPGSGVDPSLRIRALWPRSFRGRIRVLWRGYDDPSFVSASWDLESIGLSHPKGRCVYDPWV